MHSLLARQLRKARLSVDALPSDPAAWRAFLESIERAYTASDQGRELLDRAMALSSEEMRRSLDEALALNAALKESQQVLEASRQEAAAARAAAEAANSAKSLFLANMSHEIRTPMTSILGYADLIDEAGDRDRREYVGIIQRCGKHLLSLINDILDFSKIESGKFSIERVPCNPLQVVKDVLDVVRPRAVAKGLELTLVCQGMIPETIESDPTRLKQVVSNIVDNAIKFTSAGSVSIVLGTDTGEKGNRLLRIEVLDTGIGMTDEQAARLFKPFTQADISMTRRFGGTGLGLAISRHIAEVLGGALILACRPGRGCTFTLTVDMGATRHLRPREAAPITPTPIGNTLAGARILLAEDSPDNSRLIAFHLRRAGATVDVADNGRIAVNLADSIFYNVILMDMQMPELDGYGAARLLRERGCRTPIIALTAHALKEDRDQCLRSGCDDYATKPIDAPSLINMCARWSAAKFSAPATS